MLHLKPNRWLQLPKDLQLNRFIKNTFLKGFSIEDTNENTCVCVYAYKQTSRFVSSPLKFLAWTIKFRVELLALSFN